MHSLQGLTRKRGENARRAGWTANTNRKQDMAAMSRNKFKFYDEIGAGQEPEGPIVFDDLDAEVADTVEVSRGARRAPRFMRGRRMFSEDDRVEDRSPEPGAVQDREKESPGETRRARPLKLLFAAAIALAVVVAGFFSFFWDRGMMPKTYTAFKEHVLDRGDGTVTVVLDPFLLPDGSGRKKLRVVPMEMVVKKTGIYSVQSQMAAVRSIIFIHARRGWSGDAFSKEGIRKMTELINTRIGAQAVVKLRITA